MSCILPRLRLAKALVCGFIAIAGFSPAHLQAAAPSQFQVITRFNNIGLILTSIAGPGPVHGSQRLYASIAYSTGSFDILAIDPETGVTTVLRSPLANESAVWDMVLGPDGNIYMGTAPGAHFLKLDTAKGILVDLGTPSSGEQYIWAVAFGSDQRLYGGTYPNCRLVRYDPSTGRLADLGKLDSTQQYARTLTATSDGFLYAGIGSAATKVVAYQISSGRKEQILPEEVQQAGFANTYIGNDGNVYALTNSMDFKISGWQATGIAKESVPDPAAQNVLSDGRIADVGEESGALVLHVRSPAENDDRSLRLDYTGEANQLFRIGLGPDGKLYGSGALPSDLVRIGNDGSVDYIGSLGNGEAYSMLPVGPNLLLGAYADLATLALFNPGQPFSTAPGSANPRPITIPDGDICWRPQAMISAQNGVVYVGAQAGYGKLDGPLLAWNPADGSVRHWSVIPEQSVVSLAAWKDLVVGGTTIQGGPGSEAEATDAQLFLFDPQSEEVVWHAAPVPGAQTITDLVTAPNGLVYGFADKTLFEFDPSIPAVLRTRRTAESGLIYNSVGVDKVGRIWGLSNQDVFAIDTVQLQAATMGVPPERITGGFALSDDGIYFIAGTAVYSYGLPTWGFKLQNAAPSASVVAGAAAEFTFTVAPEGGFQGTVSLSCTGLPQGAACSFRPSSVASGAASHLTISTTSPPPAAALRRSGSAIVGMAACGLWLVFAGREKSRKRFARMLLVVAIVPVLFGCSEAKFTPNSAGPAPAATLPGTYTITVSATAMSGASSITRTSLITLTVK